MNATKNFLVLLENKRLYFNVNGDKIDITDKVFNNLSNIGEYMDEQGKNTYIYYWRRVYERSL